MKKINLEDIRRDSRELILSIGIVLSLVLLLGFTSNCRLAL